MKTEQEQRMELGKYTQAYLTTEVKGQSCPKIRCLEMKFRINLQ